MSRRLRIAVYGAGLVGCYLGGRLHEHADVRLILRPRLADVLQRHGLTLSDLSGHHQAIAADELDLHTDAYAVADADVVIVTVKSAATRDVATALAMHARPQALVISFQNGLHNAQLLQHALPRHAVLAGMVPFNVVQPAPGTFHQASAGSLMVQAGAALAGCLPVFAAAGLTLVCRRDMPAVLWGKLLLNLNNALNALSGVPLREQMAQRDWRRCLALLQREALALLRTAGIAPARLTAVPPTWLPAVLEWPDAVFNRLAARMLAIDPSARSSMWEDLRLGRRTEVQAINGEVVRLAVSMAAQAPANARLIALIHAAEQAPQRWAAQALWRELRRAQ